MPYPWLVAGLFVIGAMGGPSADEQTKWDDKVLSELGSIAPAAVPDARQAAESYKADRWQEAIAGYNRVLAAAPDFPHALRRLCVAHGQLGNRALALTFCRKALAAAPTPENEMALANVLMAGAEAPQVDISEARMHARQAFDAGSEDRATWEGACFAALGLGDDGFIRDCSSRLARLEPGTGLEASFGSLAAAVRGDFNEARAQLATARARGLPAEKADRMEKALDDSEPLLSRWGMPALFGLCAWIALLLLLLGAGDLLSRTTLRRARTMATARHGEGATGAALLRRIYAGVLWLTCVAYYASLPLVLLALLAFAAGLWMLFASIGRIPVKLVFAVGIAVVVTAWAIAKSLWVSVIRSRDVDPGPTLDTGAHPRFAAALREAADRVGTRPVDHVFVTPAAQAAVYERGGLARQLTGRSERCLVLGVALLDGMTQGQLKAVLAHEYGHFVNRDTAGGGLSLAVRRSILQMGRSLAEGGAATWYNPAWHFVKGFHRLFLRVSQGASRLQEILADRWAALAYGGANFAAGLEHVVARDVRFDRHASATLQEVVDRSLPLHNLYAYVPGTAIDEGELAQAVARAMAAEPSPYDSHPRPTDRIAWVGDVVASSPPGPDDGAPAWDLFADREALERRLTAEVRRVVENQHGVAIAG